MSSLSWLFLRPPRLLPSLPFRLRRWRTKPKSWEANPNPLPAPLLLGLRLVARRPRRALLSAASVTVTATGIIAVLAFHTSVHLQTAGLAGRLGNPAAGRDEQMLTILTVVLVALAVLNAICTAWATVLDARHSSALARALGATPQQVTAGIAAAQVLPAVPGALLGVPLGILLFAAANGAGAAATTVPPAWWLAAAVLGTLVGIDMLIAGAALVAIGTGLKSQL